MARGKDSRAFLLSLGEQSKKKTDEDYVRVKAKRAAGKLVANEKKPEVSEFETPKAEVFKKTTLAEAALSNRPKPGQTGSDVVNWYHVQDWFIEGIKKNNPAWLVVQTDDKWDSAPQNMWAWREKGCAERLLTLYGAEVVEKTVAWFCDNWQGIKDSSRGRLGGAPSVRLLWVSRERFFPDAKEGIVYKPSKGSKKKHMVGEYDADAASKTPRVEW